ncbi:uncharacterized protein LOC122565573 [Bombus pyrosoma]|uniref:uncharacterized protein LOC122565573 n=1 Tax=Bombus pyrosoma TaxID=396416 RepID=UPI001CB9C992|nr:uncharacterized protein LOC122565573 [Bombus pyrosoma]XP_043577584.1 uncharacterized protein LOC122565573 [Bombus pyrosoma]XP_043577585.1 uncharacterized protein LOC122565573 [Bombus pyrosoma]
MANYEEEQFSSEENLTLKELRNKLAQLNLPISGAGSVLVARLNRACSAGQSNLKGQANGEGSSEKRGSGTIPKTRRDRGVGENLERFRTKELRERLASMGLETRRRKAELRERLQVAMEEEDASSEEESDYESETEDDEEGERERRRSARDVHQNCDKCCRKTRRRTTLSFQDVQDTLEAFMGENNENINQWFKTFEETASMCMWTEEQKVIYTKKLMKGSAKIFVNYEAMLELGMN